MSMPRNLYIRSEFYLSFSVIPGSILGHLGGKICIFEVIKSLRLDVAKQETKIDRKWSSRTPNPSLVLEHFRSKSGYGLGCQNLEFFRDRLGAYKNRFGRHFWSQNGVPRPFSRACFSGFQLRDAIIEKNAPLPGENHVFACWRGLKMGRFGVRKSIKNLYFFDIHLGSDFCWFFSEIEGFGSPRRRPNFIKNRSQDDSLEILKNV